MSIKRLALSFKYALEVIHFALSHNQTIQIQFIIALLVIIASLLFHVNPFEMGILGVMILLVITTEMINTAIEEMTNLITNEHKKEAKIAKDVSAGMVLLTAIGSIIVGFLVFLPHIVRLFR